MNAALDTNLTYLLKQAGAEIVKFVDLTHLPVSHTKGYPVAILIGKVLSAGYMEMVINNPGYVQEMKINNRMYNDEFHNSEHKTDELADFIAGYLVAKGYKAYSQSEKNLLATGGYNRELQTTTLPHKTIALMAGMGWIGKHDLLVTPGYGSAVSMCTVLTNAPLHVLLHPIQDSNCGDCRICLDECPANAIRGIEWRPGVLRDEVVEVSACTTCLRCMAVCPWTRKYISRMLQSHSCNTENFYL